MTPNVVNRFCWIAAGALLVVHLISLWRFAVDWPLQDDFVQILAIPNYLAQVGPVGKVAQLFELNPQQRVVTQKLFGWLGAMLPGGLNFRLLIGIGNALVLAAGALVLLAFPKALRAVAALLAALLLTSMTHFGAQYWASAALHHFGVTFYALGALFVLGQGGRWRLLAIPLALAAAFTSANGLMVFLAAVLLLVLQQRRREALAWALGGAVVIGLYFDGSQALSGHDGTMSMLSRPVALVSLGLTTLGAIGETSAISLGIGAAIIVAWIAIVVTGAWRRVQPFVLAAMLFIALSCAMIAAGRAGYGADAVTLPRYRFYSAFAVLLTFAALAALIAERKVRWALGAACVGAVVLYTIARIFWIEHVVHTAMLLKTDRDQYAAVGHGHYFGWPPREFGDYTLNRAREIGAYNGARLAAPLKNIVGAMPPTGDPSAPSHAQMFRDAEALSIAGWMERGPSSPRLWLASDDRAFSAELSIVRYRGGGTWNSVRDGFHGTVKLAGLPPGNYRVGFGGDRVRWLEERIELR